MKKNKQTSKQSQKSQLNSQDSKKNKPVVAVIMGSQSDWPTMKLACDTLSDFGVKFHKQVISAHRTPKLMQEFAESAEQKGYKVIIAAAGGAAHLPGMTAASTVLPVIGVPVALNHLNGLDSLLSIVQMPKGVPVATVAINNATNAALLAIQILATHDQKLSHQLKLFRKNEEDRVNKMKI